MVDYTVPVPCPICAVEVRMAMEYTDDGHPDWPQCFWACVGTAPDDEQEFEEPHTCILTPEQEGAMIDLANERSTQDYYRYEPPCLDYDDEV